MSSTRNSPSIREEAAQDYRFTIRGNEISWEIPSLHEIARGTLGGPPFEVHRPGAKDVALSVRRVNDWTLDYAVFAKGRQMGEGRMTIVDGGATWIDITQPHGRPDLASAVVYIKAGKQPRNPG